MINSICGYGNLYIRKVNETHKITASHIKVLIFLLGEEIIPIERILYGANKSFLMMIWSSLLVMFSSKL